MIGDDVLAVGDAVEVVRDLPSRAKALRAGARGIVEVTGLAWGQCSVRLGGTGVSSRLFLLAPRHLRLVERAPQVGAA
jgi:hypothetical protein